MRAILVSLLAAASLILLAGCKNPPKMSLDEFQEFCNDEFGYAEDCDSGPICSGYAQAVSRQFQGVKDCVAACNAQDKAYWMENVMTDCAAVVGNATDWCDQYCRRKYQQ
ncbi:hypothetical protein NNJEOMEG_01489 [Fundidesulfovibrio magnetotacticus]|uniref:Lipoprotein n=1 Tax=Fundidesulfovibrio magnetotacticus TaxID=2730080 RepID=A0A6V8LZK1_9BACT|nr:hypothetical protein [Fundidesulfovibrio magnetotacticus]GFK93655.1 hypothetical protein NNJEOMEG_01489 [Fundidesulfovibrio magnetotacticus]